jgi:hypothetical protein
MIAAVHLLSSAPARVVSSGSWGAIPRWPLLVAERGNSVADPSIRIPSLDDLAAKIDRLTGNLAKASSGRWYRTHGVVVAMDGDAVALTDPDTLNRFGVCSHKGDPTRDNANARLICDAQNTLPSLLEVLRLLLDVPEARNRLEQARAEWLARRAKPASTA